MTLQWPQPSHRNDGVCSTPYKNILQHKARPARLADAIAEIVASVKIPVIGNGDITNAAELSHFLKQTHCAGAMIARASVGQPWIFKQLQDELAGKSFKLPSHQQIGEWFLKHINGLLAFEEERIAIYQSRKLGKYYARSIENKDEFMAKLYTASRFDELRQIVNHFFK